MAFVFEVIAFSTRSGSMRPVSGRTSTKTGVAPQWRIGFEVDTYERGVVMTSSPGLRPAITNDKCMEQVQLFVSTASFAPMYFAKSCSNALVSLDSTNQPDFSTFTAALISASVRLGFKNCTFIWHLAYPAMASRYIGTRCFSAILAQVCSAATSWARLLMRPQSVGSENNFLSAAATCSGLSEFARNPFSPSRTAYSDPKPRVVTTG